jgi:tol-pal system protein YbgF
MKTKIFSMILVVLTLMLFTSLHGQFLAASRTGIGFNAGLAKIYGGLRNAQGDPVKTGFGGSIEAYAKYMANPRLFFIGSLGYSELSDGTLNFDACTFSTDVVNLDIKAAVNLVTDKKITPYGYVGLGAIMFHQDQGKSPRLSGTYFDPAYFLGFGVETKLKPQLGLNASMDYRFTRSDDLDPEIEGDAKDGYLTMHAGLTYYLEPTRFGLGREIEVSEKAPIDELDTAELPGLSEEGDASDAELSALIEGIDNYGEASDSNLEMGEYVDLKARADQLNDAIGKKELEIEELKSQLTFRESKIAELKSGNRTGGNMELASFSSDLTDISASYNEALQSFYSKNYDTAIQQFNLLLETNPLHKLASNCQYWVGESYFGKHDYSSASQAFEQVLAFERSHKKDDALLMLGRCYLKLGDTQLAAQMFEELMSTYPDSEYFEHAQRYAGKF